MLCAQLSSQDRELIITIIADSAKAGQEGADGTVSESDRGFTPASDLDCRRVWTASRTRHVVLLLVSYLIQ